MISVIVSSAPYTNQSNKHGDRGTLIPVTLIFLVWYRHFKKKWWGLIMCCLKIFGAICQGSTLKLEGEVTSLLESSKGEVENFNLFHSHSEIRPNYSVSCVHIFAIPCFIFFIWTFVLFFPILLLHTETESITIKK